MKTKSIIPIALILLCAAWFVANNTRAERPERPRPRTEVIILQGHQFAITAANGLGQSSWAYDQVILMRASGSSGAPTYPTWIFGDVEAVAGRTNAIIPLAQVIADLRTDGWRLVQSDNGTKVYVMEKP